MSWARLLLLLLLLPLVSLDLSGGPAVLRRHGRTAGMVRLRGIPTRLSEQLVTR